MAGVWAKRSRVAAVAVIGLSACNPSTSSAPSDSELTYRSSIADLLARAAGAKAAASGEKRIAACMADRGWDYTPVPDNDGFGTEELAAFGTSNDLFDDAYRDRWGYGIATVLKADGTPVEGSPASESVVEDPNQAYVDALNETDRQRYYIDLFGAVPSPEPEVSAGDASSGEAAESPASAAAQSDSVPDPNADPNGDSSGSDLDSPVSSQTSLGDGELPPGYADSCTAQGGANSSDNAELFAAVEAINALHEESDINDPEALAEGDASLAEAGERWSACMADADHPFEQIGDPQKAIVATLERLSPTFGLPTDVSLDRPEGSEPPPADDANPLPDAGPSPTTDDVSAAGSDETVGSVAPPTTAEVEDGELSASTLEDLQRDELALADADYRCQRETYRPAYLKARAAAEKRLITEHPEAFETLERLIAAGDDGG